MSDQILLRPGDEFEKYIVEKELGHGGMGAVYLVCHKVLGVEFALKVLYPEVAKRDRQFVERFIREARLAGGIRHQNLIAVYDAGLNDSSGMYYLVMDYVAGGSVRERLKKDGYVDMVEAISIVRQVASALEAAQQRNMVHRDIKPDNIMFDSHGVVRLADLGIAKATDDSEGNLTVEATVFGTPSYMSPEQARDASKVDTRADIYSLGVVLFEMLTGRRPFGGENSIEILSHVIGPEEAPDVRDYSPDVPEMVAGLVADMLAKDMRKRIASPTALIKRIDCLDLSEYGTVGVPRVEDNAAEEDLDVTLQTLPGVPAAKTAEPEEELDVTLQTLPGVPAAKTAEPEEELDVTLQTLSGVPAAKAAEPEEELDVTLQTLSGVPAAKATEPEEELDVTLPDVPAAKAPQAQQSALPFDSKQKSVSAEHVETEIDEGQRTLPDIAHRKDDSPSPQARALKSFRFVLFGGLAALLLVVLMVGFFLVGKLKSRGGQSNVDANANAPLATENHETKLPEQTNAAVANNDVKQPSGREDVVENPAKAEVSNVNDSEVSVNDNSVAIVESQVKTAEPVLIRPVVADVSENDAEELKSLGEIIEGGVVLFGADTPATISFHSYLKANGGFAGVAYREASGDMREWGDQLSAIQGGSPAFIVVVVSKEKNTSQFRRTLDDMIKMLSAQNAAIFVNTGDVGIYEEITHACVPVGMYVRKWDSNKELATYLQDLRQELGW